MIENYYDYIYLKEYEQFGYRWKTHQLPTWIKIGIKEEGNNKYLTIYSNIHKNKETKMNPTYSNSFTDQKIIKDMSSEISKRFL